MDLDLLGNLKFLHTRCREHSGTWTPSVGAEGEMAVISASAVALHLKGYVYMAQCGAHRIFLLAIPETVQSGTGIHRHSYTFMHIYAQLG